MSYNFDPREALKYVCEVAATEAPFPPPSAGRKVSEAIGALKQEGADPEAVAWAEGLSVLLYRFEVASWARDANEPRKIREEIAACQTRGTLHSLEVVGDISG
jgi:hypothetical protein